MKWKLDLFQDMGIVTNVMGSDSLYTDGMGYFK